MSPRHKRVVICRSNPVDPDPRVEKVVSSLVAKGYQVQVLAWDRSAQLPRSLKEKNVHLLRYALRASFGSGMGNLPALFLWQVFLLRWLVKNRRVIDVIHACDFDTLLPAVIVKWFWKIPVIYDVLDFYADHIRRTPGIVKSLIRAVDLRLMEWVDAVILVDEARRNQISDIHPRRLEIIYNTPQDVLAGLSAFQTTRRRHNLNLAYVGLLQVERGLLELCKVLRRHPEWTFFMAGFGGDEKRILRESKSLPNIFWFGRIPYERALQLSFDADVLVATYNPAIANHRYSSPNKLFEAMILGKPIIVARGTHMDQIVEQHNCGLVVEYGNEEDLEEALQRLQLNPHLIRQLGVNARRAYDQFYNWPKMEERLLHLYRSILHA